MIQNTKILSFTSFIVIFIITVASILITVVNGASTSWTVTRTVQHNNAMMSHTPSVSHTHTTKSESASNSADHYYLGDTPTRSDYHTISASVSKPVMKDITVSATLEPKPEPHMPTMTRTMAVSHTHVVIPSTTTTTTPTTTPRPTNHQTNTTKTISMVPPPPMYTKTHEMSHSVQIPATTASTSSTTTSTTATTSTTTTTMTNTTTATSSTTTAVQPTTTSATTTTVAPKRNPRVQFVLDNVARARSNTTAENFRTLLAQMLAVPANALTVTYEQSTGIMLVEFKEDAKDAAGNAINVTAEFQEAVTLNTAQLGSLGAASVTSAEPAPAPTQAAPEDGPDVAVIAGAAAGGFVFLLIILFIIKKQTSAGTGYSENDQPGDRPMLEVPQAQSGNRNNML